MYDRFSTMYSSVEFPMIQEMLLKSNILRITTTLFGLYKIYKTLFSMRFAFGVLRKFEFIKEIHHALVYGILVTEGYK